VTHDIRAVTHAYITAFETRDIEGVAALMHEDFVLTDPENEASGPRENVLRFVSGLFDRAGSSLVFRPRTVLADGAHSAIEFDLTIGQNHLEGIDLIEWQDGRMISMRAHLTQGGQTIGT
jgi:ketosteroid isomerase-like protein